MSDPTSLAYSVARLNILCDGQARFADGSADELHGEIANLPLVGYIKHLRRDGELFAVPLYDWAALLTGQPS